MNICVEGLGLAVISGESLLGVGDIKSSINSSFRAANTLAPVEVLASPTSKQALNAPGPSSLSSTQYMSPSMLVFPSYTESRLNFLRILLASRSPVQ